MQTNSITPIIHFIARLFILNEPSFSPIVFQGKQNEQTATIRDGGILQQLFNQFSAADQDHSGDYLDAFCNSVLIPVRIS